jgi:CBS domain-containing protein
MGSPAVGEFMTRKVVTLDPGSSMGEAIRTLIQHRISGAPVVDANGRLVGILSEKDCLRVLTAEALDGVPGGNVESYMTREVDTVTPDANLYDVVACFLQRHFRRLPVVVDGRLVGQVSRRDALAAVEALREDSYLYGRPSQAVPSGDNDGVDSAMRRARGK